MFGVLFVIFIIAVICILLTDKTSPLYSSTLANGATLGNLTSDNSLYQQYRTGQVAAEVAKLVMTIYDSPKKEGAKIIQIYRDHDGHIVLVDHEHKIASTSNFFFDAFALNQDLYTYHPSSTVYTGATVGGIHTGGTHTNPAHYAKSQIFSGKAVISLNYAKNLPLFLTASIQLSEELAQSAKEVSELQDVMSEGGVLTLFNVSGSDRTIYQASMTSADPRLMMSAKSRLAASAGMPMAKCEAIAKWLNSVVK